MNLKIEPLEELASLLKQNSVSMESFFSETYDCLIVSLFEVLVDILSSDNEFRKKTKERIRKSENKDLTVQNIIFEETKCKISNKEAKRIYSYIYAYFTKKNVRKIYDLSVRIKKLNEQNYKCKICGKNISQESSELDHIIPWAYVGDELGVDNLQMLCMECNRHKSKSVVYNLKMFLVNKK